MDALEQYEFTLNLDKSIFSASGNFPRFPADARFYVVDTLNKCLGWLSLSHKENKVSKLDDPLGVDPSFDQRSPELETRSGTKRDRLEESSSI